MPSTRLPTSKQVYKKESEHIPTNSPSDRSTGRVYPVYKIRHKMGIQQDQDQRRRQMEGGISNASRPLWTSCNVLQPHKLACYIPSNDEWNLPNGSGPRMAVGVHGWHCYSYKTTEWRNEATTQITAQTTDPPSTWKARGIWPIPQAGEMWIFKMRNQIPTSHCRKWCSQDEPKETGGHQKLGNTQ